MFLFFVSGGTALAYEVLWLRELSLLLGSTAFSIAITLAAFMAGLGAGAQLGGRLAARALSPLRLYAGFELALVAAAAAVPFLLSRADLLLASLHQGAAGTELVRLPRAAVSFSVLLLPTLSMGGTLPALAQAVVQSPGRSARPLGALYGANTLGAALGCAATAFVLIPWWGTEGAFRFSLALNGMVAAAALVASRARAPARAEPSDGTKPSRPPKSAWPRPLAGAGLLLLVAAGVSGFVALALEVVWTRILVFFAGSTTYAFASMLSVLLLGLACGGFLASGFGDRIERRHYAVALLFVLIAVTSLGGFALLARFGRSLQSWAMLDLSWTRLLTVSALCSASVVFLPAVASGALFPLVARHEILQGSAAGLAAGRVYAFNLAGSVTGSLAAGFLLVPRLGLSGTLRALAAAMLLLSAALVWMEPRVRPGRHGRALAASLVLLAGAPFLLAPGIPLHRAGPGEELLYYREGSAATVSVLRDPTSSKTLYVDGIGVAGTDPVMQTDQKSLAHLPMLIHPAPQRVLTVGFGSGGASWSYTRYPMLERIDCVEIAPEVLSAAPHLREANHELFDDPRYRVHFDDARSHLRYGLEAYDVIATDCTDLQYRGNASLYTADYFYLCRRRLRPRGLVVVWMPLGGLTGDIFKTALQTFASVFPQVTIWYMNNYPTHYLLLVGSVEEHAVEWDRLMERMEIATVRADLESIGLADPFRLLSTFLMDDRSLRAFAAGAPVNRDAWPLIEFHAPRSTDRIAGAKNLRSLLSAMEGRAPQIPLLTRHGGAERATILGKLRPYREAAYFLNQGHVRYQNGLQEFQAAIALYRRALAANPAERQVADLIRATERTRDQILSAYETAARAEPDSPGVLLNLGLTELAAGRAGRAQEVFARLARKWPHMAEAHLNLSRAARLAGDAVAARAAADEAARLAPSRAEVHFQRGLILQDAGEAEAALDAFRRAIARDPGFAEAHFNAGTVLVSLSRVQEARASYEAGLAQDSANALARINFAQILLLDGNPSGAARELDRVASEPGPAGVRARELLATLRTRPK